MATMAKQPVDDFPRGYHEYPAFVREVTQQPERIREVYDACYRELVDVQGIDPNVAEFMIQQEWPVTLGLYHRMLAQDSQQES